MQIEYEFPMDDEFGGIATIQINDPRCVPQVGEFVMVAGYRKVKRVEHYYGVIVANGLEDVQRLERESGKGITGQYETVYVRLSRPIEHKR